LNQQDKHRAKYQTLNLATAPVCQKFPQCSFGSSGFLYQALLPGMWKRKLEAVAVEAILFLWKRKRENPTASASTEVI